MATFTGRESGESMSGNLFNRAPGGPSPPRPYDTKADNNTTQSDTAREQQQSKPHPRYKTRTCRICFGDVEPQFQFPTQPLENLNLPGFMQTTPEVVYEDEDGGRLIRPCKCKGSSKYVHEKCLAQWRIADPSSRRNFYECPTCKYQYKMSRLGWANILASRVTKYVLTFLILLLAAFILGFFAESIINVGLDPWSFAYDYMFDDPDIRYYKSKRRPDPNQSWFGHFTNGFVSLGIVGFAKVVISNPLNWFNSMRGLSAGRTGRTGTGRDRMSSTTWVAVAIGIATILWGIWKIVQSQSTRILRNVELKVMDVHDDDDEDEDP